MNTKATNTEEYIALFPKWKEQLETAQEVLDTTILQATIKWGAPCYTYKGKNVIGIVGFKNHCAIWFYKGALLKDKANIFKNAQPGKTKFLRQICFYENEKVDKVLFKSYIKEAIDLEEVDLSANKSMRVVKEIVIPQELKKYFKTDSLFKTAFDVLTQATQREYCEYIIEAKRETTKQRRIDKIIPLIMNGKRLHDKYRES